MDGTLLSVAKVTSTAANEKARTRPSQASKQASKACRQEVSQAGKKRNRTAVGEVLPFVEQFDQERVHKRRASRHLQVLPVHVLAPILTPVLFGWYKQNEQRSRTLANSRDREETYQD